MLFLTTANVTDTIPGPLLDRMEVVRLSGYIQDEKMQIARRYLEPVARAQMGLQPHHLELRDDALVSLIQGYCREAGVRNLQKHVEKICRKVALKLVRAVQPAEYEEAAEEAAEGQAGDETGPMGAAAEAEAAQGAKLEDGAVYGAGGKGVGVVPAELVAEGTNVETAVVSAETLSSYVGKPAFTSELFYEINPPGVVTGLAWTSMGGAVLYIEAQPVGRRPSAARDAEGGAEGGGGGGGGPSVMRTGQLGDVMKESVTIAHTFARSFLAGVEPENGFLDEARLHLHVPEGATPKDGPSAGVTMATSMLSLALGRAARSDLAMTGELSLTGRVLPIGGVKEKLIAARRAGVKHVIFPKAN